MIQKNAKREDQVSHKKKSRKNTEKIQKGDKYSGNKYQCINKIFIK